jgi:threonine dehydratase
MPVEPTFEDVRAAAARIRPEAVRTPLLRVSLPGGGEIFVKAETLQRTGSFKFRGAFNRLSMIPDDDRAPGVVACSSGNHAQGVAEAARILGMPATIVMPADAPAVKLARTRAMGADVVTYDRRTEDREAIANTIAARTGATFVHPFDDPGVIAGQGTVGLEIAEDCAAHGLIPDAVLVCCSGGGLASGIALALEQLAPATTVHTVEPEGFDDYARSLAAGERVSNERLSGSICDALLSESPGAIGFSIARRRFGPGLVVSDDEALAAVGFAARELKLVVEPGGAVALAAVLAGKLPTAGRTVVAVLSGGNIDDAMMTRALAQSPSVS